MPNSILCIFFNRNLEASCINFGRILKLVRLISVEIFFSIEKSHLIGFFSKMERVNILLFNVDPYILNTLYKLSCLNKINQYI